MKKVVFVYRFLPQYREDFFQRLKNALFEDGIELHLIYGKSKNSDSLKKDEIDISWAKFVPNKIFRVGKIELLWQSCLKEIKDADLVIVQPENKLLLNYYLMIARQWAKYKVGFWGHGRNMQADVRSWRNRFKSLHLTKCDWWFAYTSGVKEIISKTGFSANKITVVQNAIDTVNLRKQYADISEEALTKIRFDLKITGDQIGIYCGAMYVEKGVDFILNACLKIKKEVPGFHMIFVGAGIEDKKVRQAADIYDWIHYVGAKFGNERVKYFKLSAIQLMPKLVGLGIVDSFVLETPIVTTDDPFHGPEIDYLENNVNGIMTKYDINTYAAAIVELFKTKKYLTLLEGCKTSARRYTLEAMIENFKTGIVAALEN